MVRIYSMLRVKSSELQLLILFRGGQPDDIASLAHHILIDSTWMTGQIIKVDGKSKLL